MLSPTAKKFQNALGCIQREGLDGPFLADGFSIAYGNFSSRTKNGVKVQDARLYYRGKLIANYDATTDEITATGLASTFS